MTLNGWPFLEVASCGNGAGRPEGLRLAHLGAEFQQPRLASLS